MLNMLNAVPTTQIIVIVILAVLAVLVWLFFALSFTNIPFMKKIFSRQPAEETASAEEGGEAKAEGQDEAKPTASESVAKEAAAADDTTSETVVTESGEKHIYIHHVYEGAPEPAPAAAPAPAPAPAEAPAPAKPKKVVFEDDDEDDDNEYGIIMVDDKPVRVAYRKSFQARLIETTDEIKSYYCQVANHILAYRLKGRVSWGYLSFNHGKDPFVKLNIESNALCVYFALPYKEFKESEEFNVEKARTKKYEKTPVMMRVTSNKSAKSAMDLVDILSERVELKRGSAVNVEKVEKYPLDTKENLIQRGLIKYTVLEGDPNTL